MINLYVSLVSSLPLLRMTEPPPMSYGKFMSDCAIFIHGEQYHQLEQFSLIPGLQPEARKRSLLPKGANQIAETRLLPEGGAFELALTSCYPNEIVKIFPAGSLAREYLFFEIAIRHSAMKIRAAKLGAAFSAPKPGYAHFDPEADRAVRAAYAVSNPVERERILDAARWDKLDELEVKNLTRFNFDTICAYSIRIQIAEKWAARSAGNSSVGLDQTASAVRASDPDQVLPS